MRADPPGGAWLVAFGTRTSIGSSAGASFAAARAAIRRFSLLAAPSIGGADPFTIAPAACLPEFQPHVRASLAPRLLALTTGALQEVLAGRNFVPGGVLPVYLALATRRPGLPEVAGLVLRGAGAVLSEHGIKGTFVPIVEDHAGGLMAFAQAVDAIATGRCEACIVGGVDSYLHADTLAWLHEREQLKSEANRWGFVASEAAAFALVTSAAWARARDVRPLAEVTAAATGRETVTPRGAEPLLGRGLTTALRGALAALPAGQRVDELVCDLNGERWRGDDAGFTIARLADAFATPGQFSAPALAFGDVGAASGPLFCGVAAHAAAHGFTRGPRTLIWASSESGARGAALLTTSRQNME